MAGEWVGSGYETNHHLVVMKVNMAEEQQTEEFYEKVAANKE